MAAPRPAQIVCDPPTGVLSIGCREHFLVPQQRLRQPLIADLDRLGSRLEQTFSGNDTQGCKSAPVLLLSCRIPRRQRSLRPGGPTRRGSLLGNEDAQSGQGHRALRATRALQRRTAAVRAPSAEPWSVYQRSVRLTTGEQRRSVPRHRAERLCSERPTGNVQHPCGGGQRWKEVSGRRQGVSQVLVSPEIAGMFPKTCIVTSP